MQFLHTEGKLIVNEDGKEVLLNGYGIELRFLTEHEKWESEAGSFEVYIGSDSRTTNKALFCLK